MNLLQWWPCYTQLAARLPCVEVMACFAVHIHPAYSAFTSTRDTTVAVGQQKPSSKQAHCVHHGHAHGFFTGQRAFGTYEVVSVPYASMPPHHRLPRSPWTSSVNGSQSSCSPGARRPARDRSRRAWFNSTVLPGTLPWQGEGTPDKSRRALHRCAQRQKTCHSSKTWPLEEAPTPVRLEVQREKLLAHLAAWRAVAAYKRPAFGGLRMLEDCRHFFRRISWACDICDWWFCHGTHVVAFSPASRARADLPCARRKHEAIGRAPQHRKTVPLSPTVR